MKLLVHFLSFAAAIMLAVSPAQAQTVYALMNSTDTPTAGLAWFDASSPGTLTRGRLITGMNGLLPIGIAVQPSTGELYLLGYNSNSAGPQCRLFTLSTTTSIATPVGPALALNLGNSPFNVGFGFDPITGLVRMVVNTSNYRLDPATATLLATDSPLAYASTDANAGQLPGVGAIGFSNDFGGSASTVLYGLDKLNNRLVTQSPPNTGTLHTVGPLSLNVSNFMSSFDVGYSPASGNNTLYLVRTALLAQDQAIADLYTLNPATGTATLVGPVGSVSTFYFISDIAVARTVVSATRARTTATTAAQLYPNPATNSASLAFTLTRPGTVTIEVFDMIGRLVSSQTPGLLSTGPHTVRWEAPANCQGIYMLRLNVDGQAQDTFQVQLMN